MPPVNVCPHPPPELAPSAELHEEPEGSNSVMYLKLIGLACSALSLGAIVGCHSSETAVSSSSPKPSSSMVSLAAAPEPAASTAALDSTEHAIGRSGISTRPLSALTFNMEHRDRPNELAAMANGLTSNLSRLPDFILMQEVNFKRPSRKGEDNTAAVLANLLGYYSKGTKRTSDREGIAIASRFPFDYYDHLHLKSQTNRLLLGFRRVSVMGEFLVPSVGRVRVVNVHLTNWGFEAHVRAKQLQETLEWTAARQKQVPAEVTIFGGDFNIEPGWHELGLVNEAAHTLGLRFHDYNTEQSTHGPEGNPRHRVDYIFISAPHAQIKMHGERRMFVDGLTHERDGDVFYVSDHVPVLHEYTVSTTRGMTPSEALRSAAVSTP
jgi:endonuclease/exonuclease/phosphatase family metal-dependent hydrolase